MDAPSGLMGLLGRAEMGEGLTREAQTSPSRTRASDQGAERQASDKGKKSVPSRLLANQNQF
ncbi:hypothetical protein ACTRXD_04540 [Nitrospira sp. T9]|uniref:hypothetical protein n=1 Tax=unclassified Nitrospira TaxID=2652172 RepID=UPI003F99F458